MHLVVAAALLRSPGEVLLCHRSADRQAYPAVWDFAGGHIEEGEDPLDTLGREVFEELGVETKLEALTESPDLRLRVRDLDLSVWIVREWEGEPSNCAPEEHDRVEWFDLNHVATMSLAHPAYLSLLCALSSETDAR